MTAESEQRKDDAGKLRDEDFTYSASGIQEKRGGIPLWLILVAVGLIAWSVYYTVANWSPPP